ncbi:MAG TPA: sensor histidine kinase [Actinophytocola sp.]|uniref:sensor histidine kinase n=1 Tax=Actinophytocola sp. TaxID=1872138 RepID=UPI002DDD48A7|nr:sensor histidine kinase [Actinophytocola sp.]HEV2780578.1 sensor histidine kinase [Actinophytocola sp.]
MSLARQLLVLQVIIVGLLVVVGALLVYLDVADRAEDAARDKVVAVARTVADAPTVVDTLGSADPTTVLQPLAERIRGDTGVDFVVIMQPDGRRYTHPNPAMIGGQFLGHTEEARAGNVFTETYTGTLGPSVRAVVPVYGTDDEIVALVSVGITLNAIAGQVRDRMAPLAVVVAGALAIGTAGTYLVSRRIRRQTHGLGPAELGRRIDYHEAILHAVREGLLLIDKDHRVTLCNDGARQLLDLSGEVEGRRVDELGLPDALVRSLSTDQEAHDELQLTDRRVLVVNSAPVRSGDRAHGSVVTLRDHTDLQALTGELDSMRGFAESLRSQAHEAANRLHTVVSLVELGRSREAVEFATAELEIAQRLTDRVVGAVAEPVLAALLLGKAAEASERGAQLVVTEDTEIDDAVLGGDLARDVVTILGNLIDNALDAALEAGGRPQVFVTARTEGGELVLRVADTGDGLDPARRDEVFRRGWSTKTDGGLVGRGLGLALVGQAVRRCRGTIDVSTQDGAVFTVRLPVRPGVRA